MEKINLLSNAEMKNVTGGLLPVAGVCQTGAFCQVYSETQTDVGTVKSLDGGFCNSMTVASTIACYCSAGDAGGNKSGRSHCWSDNP